MKMFYVSSSSCICCVFLLDMTRKQKQLSWAYNKFCILLIAEYCTALPFFFSWMAFCLSRCNFIWKSASAALVFFLPAYCSRYLLSYLWFYRVETHGIIYHHYKISSFSVIHFVTAIKNILFLAILLSVIHKNLQTTTFITVSLSITYQLHAAVQNLFSQRALSYRK